MKGVFTRGMIAQKNAPLPNVVIAIVRFQQQCFVNTTLKGNAGRLILCLKYFR
jgi:hypothetical protein